MSKNIQIISWNVNGVRAAAKNGMLNCLSSESPDILCMQEVKAMETDLDEVLKAPYSYKTFWFSAEKKGYSGVGVYTKIDPLNVTHGLGIKQFDLEGRVLTLKFKNHYLINAYFPNSQREHTRLGYKLDFCQAMEEYCQSLIRKGGNIILCGDLNIAHKEIDLANPKQNMKNAGFLPEERNWMDKFTESGFVDTFRHYEKGGGHYSWWSYRPGVREKNIGWRLDYHLVNKDFMAQVVKSSIHKAVRGSDHCPVMLELKRD